VEGVNVWGADLVTLWAPSRLPMLSVPLGLPTLDVCGPAPRLPSPVLGENRNVLTEDEPDRSEPMLDPKLRGLEVPEPRLPTEPPLTDGPGELKKCWDGAVEKDLSPPPKPLDGADGIAGAGLD
jgi:hypothetical protein